MPVKALLHKPAGLEIRLIWTTRLMQFILIYGLQRKIVLLC